MNATYRFASRGQIFCMHDVIYGKLAAPYNSSYPKGGDGGPCACQVWEVSYAGKFSAFKLVFWLSVCPTRDEMYNCPSVLLADSDYWAVFYYPFCFSHVTLYYLGLSPCEQYHSVIPTSSRHTPLHFSPGCYVPLRKASKRRDMVCTRTGVKRNSCPLRTLIATLLKLEGVPFVPLITLKIYRKLVNQCF